MQEEIIERVLSLIEAYFDKNKTWPTEIYFTPYNEFEFYRLTINRIGTEILTGMLLKGVPDTFEELFGITVKSWSSEIMHLDDNFIGKI